jgi:hypothetical protein
VKSNLIWAAKAVAIWVALLAGSMIGNMATTLPVSADSGSVPLPAGQAFLLVNALVALVLAALGARMTGPLWLRAISLFVLLYVTETLLSTIESFFFGAFLHLPETMLSAIAAANAVKSAVAAGVAAALWRGDGLAPAALQGLYWKLPAIALLYVFFYFGAGTAIAWQSAAVRAYYGDGIAIDRFTLLLVQIGRGAIWAGLVWMLARGLNGSIASKGVLAGAAFAVIMAAPLLYPNAYMPWSVRQVHFVEIGVSNFLFGLLAILLLSWRRTRPAAG